MNKNKQLMSYLWVGAGVFFLDRLTKACALAWCREPCVINRFLSFELMRNTGVTWGMLSGNQGIGTYVVTGMVILIAVIFVGLAWYRLRCGRAVWAEALVIGGALSNIVDRFMYAGVIDFIALSYRGWTWPVFNIADAFIVIGIGCLTLQIIREGDA